MKKFSCSSTFKLAPLTILLATARLPFHNSPVLVQHEHTQRVQEARQQLQIQKPVIRCFVAYRRES